LLRITSRNRAGLDRGDERRCTADTGLVGGCAGVCCEYWGYGGGIAVTLHEGLLSLAYIIAVVRIAGRETKYGREEVERRTAQGGMGFPRPWAWIRVHRGKERESAIGRVKKYIF
jgi:hypothetical protein